MNKIIVKEIIGTNDCYSVEQGELLYNIIIESLKSNHNIVIDFKDTNVICSKFFTSSFARLCDSKLKSINIINLSPFVRQMLNDTINSKRILKKEKDEHF